MKRIQLFLLLMFMSALIYGQKAEQYLSGVVVANQFAISKPLTELPPFDETKVVFKEKESGDRKKRKPQEFPFTVEKDGEAYGNERSSLQTEGGGIEKGQNKIAWAGQNASGFRPFDPSGAVGPNHFVQMINGTTFKVYDKTNGNVLLTQLLGNLWSPATANAGDPIVMYDKAADRWFLAQFGSGNNNIYIALSTTSDPLGSYYTWTFTSPAFPDYLKFSVWQDGYYMTSNQGTQRVFAFERSAMLTGTPAARSVFQTYTPPQGGGFFCPIPGDASDGNLPPVGTPCPIMSFSDNGWGGGNIDAVQIYNMTVDWVPSTPTAVIALASAVPTAAFDASYESSWDNCVQPGTTQKLDAIGGIVQYRAQWKSWAGYNSVVLNWSVRISATQRSIKWVELRQSQINGVWSVYQEGIYTPDGSTRWMGSIAMDNNGSIGLSYIKSDATSIFPGLYWTGRRACDPIGTLPITETTVVVGTGFQTGTNRVGDYAHCTLDPDGVTFWNTSEYMGGTSGGSAARTHIFSYQIQPCTSDAIVNISVTSGSNPSCAGNNITFTASPFNQGTTPIYQWKLDGANVGTNSPTYSSSAITNGQTVSCVMTSNLPGVTNNPATSNSIVVTVNPSVPASVAIALTGGTNPTCPGVGVTFTATPTNGGTSPFYQWQVGGVNAGANSPTFTTSTITNGQAVTCLMTSNSASCPSPTTSTSNAITVNVTNAAPAVSITQTAGTNPTCAGVSTTFTATVTNGNSPTYQWKVNGGNVGTNSPTYTTTGLTNGQIVSCSVTSTSTCPVSGTLGTDVLLNPIVGATAGLAAAYPTYWGNGRQQYLILASELTALGFAAGPVNSVSFNINGTVGDPVTLNGYTIKMAATAATALTTTFQAPTFTTVFGPTNYTPTLNSLNTHNFSGAFNWNGSSNVLVDICFSNQVVGNAAYQSYQSTTPFVATTYYEADNAGGAGACTTTTGVTGSRRPNMIFIANPVPVVSNSNTITMVVNANVTPSVSIALTTGTNPGCAGSSLTFTATPTNGGTTPDYQWKVNGSNAGTNSPTFTTSSLTNGQIVTCVLTSNAACASPTTATSNGITINITANVAPAVAIALTTGSNPTCAGSSLTFTATPTNGGTTPAYQWKVNGSNAGTNSPTFTTSSLTNGQVVSCELTSNAACASPTTATSNAITVTVNATVIPAVTIALTTGSNPTCAGSSMTFTATPTNGGTTPGYQWKVDGTNAGINSATFTTSSLTNGQVVSCVMTSNSPCASPTTATSNAITINITASVVPSVAIALTTGSNPGCAGSSLTFTATPSNGGTTPGYQWKVDGTNAGTNSATFTTSSLTNGQIVTCVMTSNSPCASPTTATSNAITINITANVVPSVAIALTTGSNPGCAGSSLTFTATPSNGGATPAYQWKIDGSNAGTNSATFTTSSLTNGQVVTCVMTSNAACASPSFATSNGITMTINSVVTPSVSIALTTGSNPSCAGSSITFTATPANGGTTPSYQWKVNGSNAGTNSTTFTASSLTNGQIVTCVLTSNAACLSVSTATSNSITISITTSVTWYADTDNDGYGNALSSTTSCAPPLGFVSIAGDCNDNNSAINPGATEICSNGIDEDCDGTPDDGCTTLVNDLQPNAISLVVGPYNTCNSISGNLTQATASPESQSTAVTGEDLWYSFVALSPGVQIKVSTTAINVLVELQNSAGVMIDSENIQSTKSNENLNIGSLTPGATYFVAVRNFNSAQGTGAFSICLSDLPSSGCLTPAPSYTMCSKFKAIVVNAANYVYNFTSTQTNITYSRTQPSAILDLYKVTGGMPTGANYDARVDAIYTVTRGNGTTESITVQAVATCNFLFAADPLLVLATTQDCPSPRPLGVNIRSNTTVCYAGTYLWEFQKADLSEPVFAITGGSTQYLLITSAMGFVPGTTYNVRIRVTYQNGYTNPWGPWRCLLIAGGAGMGEFQEEQSEEHTMVRMDDFAEILLYPNPGNGEMINLEIDGIES
ncbi:MAG: beta strand repeat-containing protein, partial [Flavobacteriales bacterium]